MTDELAKQPPKPWRWPAEWVRDQSFWKDVASRSLSGLIVIFLAWLGAVALGYLGEPEFAHYLANVLLMMTVVVILLTIPLEIRLMLRLKRAGRDEWKIWIWSVIASAGIVPGLILIIIQDWEYQGP